MHILLVINPISGVGYNDELDEQIGVLSRRKGVQITVLETEGTDDRQRLEETIEEIHPHRIGVAGGDGTINMVASVLIDQEIPLGIIPTGSANGLATALGLPKDLRGGFELLYEGYPRPLDAVKVNRDYLSFHLSDLGFNARMIKKYERDEKRGMLTYAQHFFSTAMEADSFRLEFALDGGAFEPCDAHLAVLANTRKYGTGAVINPEGAHDDGRFELCLIKPQPKRNIAKIFTTIFYEPDAPPDYLDIYSCQSLKINVPQAEELQIDGELIGKIDEVEAEVVPEAVSLLFPAGE